MPLIRGARVFISEPDARFVIVQDCFASDEDRLLLFDTRSQAPPAVVTHDDGDGYSHQHFEINGMADGVVRAAELEWAGDTPPRRRVVTITRKAADYSVTDGPWTPARS